MASARRRERETERAPGSARPGAGPLRRAWEQVSFLVWAVLLALLIRAVVIESYYVPSESMLPTLLVGDHVFVNKFAYGARVPFTDWQLPALREPERGDVVVFQLGQRASGQICPLDRCPDYPAVGFVKRIVGLPGDAVEVQDGEVYLNGERVALRATGEVFRDDRGDALRVELERLGDGEHAVLDHPASPGLPQVRTRVPEGHYFVMGDNRDNSNDSRGWGTVPRRDLKGPVMRIYWSWNNRESWLAMLNPLTWLRLIANETRWHRIGDAVR